MTQLTLLRHHDKVTAGYTVLVQEEDGSVWRAMIEGIAFEASVIRMSLFGGWTEMYRHERREWGAVFN
jgi:hypothetical protein